MAYSSTNPRHEPVVITRFDAEPFDRGDFHGHVYVDQNSRMGFTALRVFIDGKHPCKEMGESTTRTYLVTEGAGIFGLNDKTVDVKEGDFVVIPPGGQYEYEGNMTLFEMNISPDNSFDSRILE